MAKSANQRSVTQYQYLNRAVPQWYVPTLGAEKWRSTVKQIPVAGLCERNLIGYIRGLQWSIAATDSSESEKYHGDIEYYTHVIDGGLLHAPTQSFDNWIDTTLQDTLTLPVGGNIEVVRYGPGKVSVPSPYKLVGNHPRGHAYKIVYVDGGTLGATGDDTFPLIQRPPNKSASTIYFPANTVGRVLNSPRPEIQHKGWGVAPPEWVYLALLMLWRGDIYYYQLLTDTPESGILYLGDVEEEDVTDWLSGFRAIFQTDTPMKLPVWYGPDKPEVVPFNRPPMEMTFNETSMKYARVVAASYGLKLSDIGLEGGTETLAGKIRDQAQTRITGYGAMQTMIENMVNSNILPPYLTFKFKIIDPESMIQQARARLMTFQWAKTAKDAGVLSVDEIREQIKQDGVISIKLADKAPEEEAPPESGGATDGTQNSNTPALPNDAQTQSKQLEKETKKVSPEAGGHGDLTTQKSLPIMFGLEKGTSTSKTDSGLFIVQKSKGNPDTLQEIKIIEPATPKSIPEKTLSGDVISIVTKSVSDKKDYEASILKSGLVKQLANDMGIDDSDSNGMAAIGDILLGLADIVYDKLELNETISEEILDEALKELTVD